MTTLELVERIRSRPNDAPMETERLLDEAAEAIQHFTSRLQEVEIERNQERAKAFRLALKVSILTNERDEARALGRLA